MEFLFFTKEESFREFFGEGYDLKNSEEAILGTHRQIGKNSFGYFLLRYIIKNVIALNLPAFSKYVKNEDKIMESIAKTIVHEAFHECLYMLDIKLKQQHWAMSKLGLNGI